MGCSFQKCNKKNRLIQIEGITDQGSSKEVSEFPNKLISSRYSIIQHLGHGFSSSVYLCFCKRTKQEIALKVVKKDSISSYSPEYSKEVSIMRKLDHPNILKCFDSVEDANNLYISQEYASGCDLRRFMRKNFEKLTESKLVKIMFQVMLGLSYIHEKNVVHRDIKLENVYLSNSSSFQIKLADFGYSEYGNSKKGLQGVFGTTQYLAPEMFNRAYNEKVDIWSAGVMLFILSTGKNPYTVKNQDILIEIIKTQPLSSLRSEVQDKSANFRSFLDGLLQINPNKRFSAREALRHDWINSKIKTTFDPSLLVQEVRSVNEKNLFKKVFSLLSSYLFIENCENKKINQFFQKLDRNFEGSVKKEEYEKQLKNLFDEAGARDYAQMMFDSWDLDLDGEIQYLEFSSALMHRKNVSNEKKIEMVFGFFKESQENFIVSQKLSEFLGFCSSGKYLSCLKNQKIAEKLSFDEFKELLSAD